MKKIVLVVVIILVIGAGFFYYSSKQGYKARIASACSGGGKVISQTCADLLKEYRQKFPEATSDVNPVNTTELVVPPTTK